MENKILVTGYSKIPGGIAGSDVYSVIGVSMIVKADTGIILDADSTLVIGLARNYIRNILLGENLTDLHLLESKLKAEYYGTARKALIVAIKICYDKYLKALENRKLISESEENGD